MSLLARVTVPEGRCGAWRVERFTTRDVDWGAVKLGRDVPVGETFTRLLREETLVMSDTPAEMRDHLPPVLKAEGSCLINGLGLGLVLQAVLKRPSVTDVTVVEVATEVLDLVAPHYADPRVTYIHHDALTYTPPVGKRYRMVWHDIWDEICADNLPQMHRLHRKYGRRADWQGSWCRWRCERGY